MDSRCVLLLVALCGGYLLTSVHSGFSWSAIAHPPMGWVRSWVELLTRFLSPRGCSVGTAKCSSYFLVPRKVVFLPVVWLPCFCETFNFHCLVFFFFHFFKRCLPLKSSSSLRTGSRLTLILWSYTFKCPPFDYFVAKSTWSQSCSESSPILREMLSSWLWHFSWGVLPPLGILLQSPDSVRFSPDSLLQCGLWSSSAGSVCLFPPWRVNWCL